MTPAAAAEQAARRSYGRLVAYLSARSRDVAGAEDALADAFETALARWPVDGVPDNPDAWLLTVARRKTIDALRGRRRDEEAAAWLQWLAELETPSDAHALPDRRLELMFACAHPAIDAAARAPLMLQAVLGFDAATIAAAFLVAPAAMSQRLVRAKAKIRQAGIGLQVPARAELGERLGAVLSAIYAVYADAWTDAAGTDPRRRDLAEEAIWLARLVASLLPQESEALGLLALMLYSHARRAARRDADGVYIPLTEQNPAQWEQALIKEAEGLLHLAASHGRPGRYQLEAAVQSAHLEGRRSGRVDWAAIERLYAGLFELTASPVAALNHAVALSNTAGAAAGLTGLDALHAELCDYQPYWAARAELLGRSKRYDEARQASERAIALESDAAVREFLRRRAAAWGPQ